MFYSKIYRGKWLNHDVTVNVLRSAIYRPDFSHGLEMLTRLQPNRRVTQLIGYCVDTDTFVTEFYRFGSADNLPPLLQSDPILRHIDSPQIRFRMCIDYAKILTFLHDWDGPVGRRVLCDSNDLVKTAQQFLVTNDLRLVVNDLDALPEIQQSGNSSIKCGRRAIDGDFAAPEQRWPSGDMDEFDDKRMPGYNEKSDVWKIPDVCGFLLGDRPACRAIAYRLFRVHNRCKESDPKLRPTAQQVLDEYRNVWRELGFT